MEDGHSISQPTVSAMASIQRQPLLTFDICPFLCALSPLITRIKLVKLNSHCFLFSIIHLGLIPSTQNKAPQVIQFQPFQPIQPFTTCLLCMQNYALSSKRTWKFTNDAYLHRSCNLFPKRCPKQKNSRTLWKEI